MRIALGVNPDFLIFYFSCWDRKNLKLKVQQLKAVSGDTEYK